MEGSTFIGGTENDGIMEKYMPLTKNYGDQFRGEVIVDAQDNIYSFYCGYVNADHPGDG